MPIYRAQAQAQIIVTDDKGSEKLGLDPSMEIYTHFKMNTELTSDGNLGPV